MELQGIFLELTVIMVLAAFIAIILKALKQPAVLSYIFVGLLLGPIGLFELSSENVHALEALSKLGITFLLFILGLELKVGELRSVGKVAFITGVAQIVFTSIVGFGIAQLLGFDVVPSLYLAIGLTFSSTIVIVKLLSDKKDLNSLYGRISVGFLLVQDFVAIIALVILTSIGSTSGGGDMFFWNLLFVLLKAFVAIAVIVYISDKIIPKVVHYIAKSQELLYITAIAWAFGVSAILSSSWVGLSIEIGGFLAGLALANSVESLQIVSKIRALRDFFIVIFFVYLGSELDFTNIGSVLVPGILFSVFVLIGNPIIVMAILGALGYKKRTGFMAGLTVAQVSEFSLIVINIGATVGHLNGVENDVIAILTIVTIITFTISSYMVINSETLYRYLSPYLNIFERKGIEEKQNFKAIKQMKNHIVVVGAHRLGKAIIESAGEQSKNMVAVDFDPTAIDYLEENDISNVFGDIVDPDVQAALNLDDSKAVISTVPHFEENLILMHQVKELNPNIQFICVAKDDIYVDALYDAGVDFVIQPFAFVGRTIGKVIRDNPKEFLSKLKRKRVY